MLVPDYGEAAHIITDKLVLDLAATSPEVVWVGLGAPKQDEGGVVTF